MTFVKFFAIFAAAILFGSSPHKLASVTPFENEEYELMLEDGSIWKVSSYDGDKAIGWRSNDPITVTQNNRWFSRHSYRIINDASGVAVEANLFRIPDPYGPYSRYIVSVDYDRKEVLLSDNTLYDVSFLDTSVLRGWTIHNFIIIAINSNVSFLDSGKDLLLINASTNDAVRAKKNE